MIDSPISPVDKPLAAVAAPVLALLVIAVALGYFALLASPWLQQIAPLDEWPMTAQIMHWVSPWAAAGAGILAASLYCGGLDGVWPQYFTNRRTVIALLVWSLLVAGLTVWTTLSLAMQLLASRI